MIGLTQISSAVTAVVVLVACGGGGSVTDLGGLSARFTPDQALLPPNSVSLREGSTLGDTVTVEVWAQEITLPAFITTFELRFDPAMVEFVGFEPGNFFEQQVLSSNVTYTVPQPLPGTGRLNVRIDKAGTPLGSQGDGIFLKLQFRVVTAGTSALAFEDPILADANGLGAQNVEWLGGRLEGF